MVKNDDINGKAKSKFNDKTEFNSESALKALVNVGKNVPPHSNEAEIAVLGAMMIERTAISKTLEIIDADSFYNERNKVIFEIILTLFDRGVGVDIITIVEELNRTKQLEKIGGPVYLAEINSKIPTAANVEYHARIMQEKFLKRSLINVTGKILTSCYDDATDALEEIDVAEQEIFKIAEKRFSKGYVDISTLAHEAIDMIYKLVERDKDSLTGVPTGFTDLDKILGGFQNSDFIVLAARPSMGKTALALSIARNAAVDHKMPIAFFSIEMAAIQLVIRLISAETRINAQSIRTGFLNSEAVRKIVHNIGRLADSKMFIDDSPSLSMTELRAKCRRLKIEHGVKLVMIDYLQLLHPPKAESREREISIISRSLKQLAKELDIPIVAMAQLNRGVEGRADKRPMLSDLRESGSIEQDADVVMFIYRPEYYGIKTWPDDQQPTENTASVIIGKQRNGPTGEARLVFEKDFAKFDNGLFGVTNMNLTETEGEDDDFGVEQPF